MKMGEIKKNSILGLVVSSLIAIAGCSSNSNSPAGGSSSAPQNPPAVPPGTPVVSISPAPAYVQVNRTVQFKVEDAPANVVVSWSVSGNCVGTDCGTIDLTGKYLAPPTPHDAPGLTIQASSTDPAFTATAVVFVTPAPTRLAVSPASATLLAGGKQTFTATGEPSDSVPVVSWAVSGSSCQAATCGTIDAQGNYQAPASISSTYSVQVTATSVADPSISASAEVTLGTNPNNAKLNGQYAFIVGGYDGGGSTFMAGTFVADGNGNITSGIEDMDFSSDIAFEPNLSISGTYSVNSDNLATLSLVPLPQQFSLPTILTVALSPFSAGVANRGRIIGLEADIRTTGILAKQDPSAFSTNALSGGYAFGFEGNTPTGTPMDVNGRFTATGGSITEGQTDTFGLALSDQTNPGTNLSFTGAYQVSANGRGTAALSFDNSPGFSRFTFYVVSASELLFIESDNPCGTGECTYKGGMIGTALQQSGGPFTSDSLNGNSVFRLTGIDIAATAFGRVAVGSERFDGRGGVTGTEYKNDNGDVVMGASFDGQFSVDPNGLGRGEITLSGDSKPKPIYLVSPGKAFIIDSNNYDSGFIEPQTGTAFGDESLSGDYVFGTLPFNFDWAFEPSCGLFTADGNGSLNGVSDGYGGTNLSFAGGYKIAQNGEATVTFNPQGGSPSNWVFFFVSPSKAVGIDVDPGSANTAVTIIEH